MRVLLHRHIGSPSLAHLLLLEFNYRWNIKMALKHRGLSREVGSFYLQHLLEENNEWFRKENGIIPYDGWGSVFDYEDTGERGGIALNVHDRSKFFTFTSNSILQQQNTSSDPVLTVQEDSINNSTITSTTGMFSTIDNDDTVVQQDIHFDLEIDSDSTSDSEPDTESMKGKIISMTESIENLAKLQSRTVPLSINLKTEKEKFRKELPNFIAGNSVRYSDMSFSWNSDVDKQIGTKFKKSDQLFRKTPLYLEEFHKKTLAYEQSRITMRPIMENNKNLRLELRTLSRDPS